VVLPVDVAVSKDGLIAIASAGGRDSAAPSVTPIFSSSSVQLLTLNEVDRARSGECRSGASSLPVQDQAVAVAFTPSGQLVVQTREPSQIVVIDSPLQASSPRTISLGGDARLDTGHEIFHRDAGSGIACASCHVEGTDDGRVWHFQPIGARRTQPIDVGLKDTEPFHWDGTLPTMDRLMNEVFVTRMGGPRESGERVGALSEWVFQLPPRAPLRPAMDASAERGKALFESGEVGCSSCHNGPKFTNNKTVDVGTGLALQVPSLLGVSQRLPLMHNGCAQTLLERFDASCGGNAHGDVARLAADQLADLVAYLETI
jgi:hypothetical protein